MDGKQVHRQRNRSAEEDCEHRCQITDMQITKPVSYTHLDVYKRQVSRLSFWQI